MGITVKDYEGPNEPTGNYPPASVCIYGVNAGSPAEKAGLKQYDFIYAVNDERVTSFRELTAVLDRYQAGDTVKVTVVRYDSVYPVTNTNNYYNDIFGSYFGRGFGYGYGPNYGQDDSSNSQSDNGNYTGEIAVSGGYNFVDVEVTLELPEED